MVIKKLQVNSINIIALEAKLMAICTGLIPAMEIVNVHNIIVITDSIAAERKILESKVKPLQNMVILLTSAIKSFFSKDSERVQKGIAYWDKQNNDVQAPNCMLKVWGEIIKI